jgi:site-specific DNA recombinase
VESAWSNGKPAYRCRHGHATARAQPTAAEERLRPRGSHRGAPARFYLLLTGPAGGQRRRRTRRGIDVRYQAAGDAISYLREQQIILIFDPASGTLHAGTGEAAQTITLKAS